MTEPRDESRDRGPPYFSFDPNVKTLEAKVLWPAVKYKQKTKAKMHELRSSCEEGTQRDGRLRGLAQNVPLSPREHDAGERTAGAWSPAAAWLFSVAGGKRGLARAQEYHRYLFTGEPRVAKRGVTSPRTTLATKPNREARSVTVWTRKTAREVDFRIKLKSPSLFQSLFSFFSRQFILINLLNNKNTSEENYVHFIQFVLTICFETINWKML